MTVSEATPIDRYTGDGSTVAFSFSYEVFNLADVVVKLLDDSDPNVDKTGTKDGSATYDYTVTGSLSGTTNRYTSVTVTFNTAPPSGWLVGLTRAQDLEQDTSLTNGGAFSEKSVEFQLDKLVHMAQDNRERLDRANLANPASLEHDTDMTFDGSATVKGLPDPSADGDAAPRSWVTGQLAGFATSDLKMVASIAAMTALDTDVTTEVIVLGYYAAGDGGGGRYYWDASSTDTENGGSILESDAGGTGRWLLAERDVVSVRQFGAKGDASNDDTTAIEKAFLAGFGTVRIDAGDYLVTTVKFPSQIRIVGDGYADTKIRSSTNAPILQSQAYDASEGVEPTGQVQLSDFTIVGDDTGTSQIGILLFDYYSTIQDIVISRTLGASIQLEHRDDGGTAAGGTLVNNRIHRVRTFKSGPFLLGDEDNNKLTDGTLADCIISISTGQDYALEIGSAAGWFIDEVHTEGNAPAESSVRLSNGFHTSIGRIYTEGSTASKPCVVFNKTQRAVTADSLSIILNKSGAIGLTVAKSGAVSDTEVQIGNLTIVNTGSSIAATGVSVQTSTVKVSVGAKNYVNTSSGTITDDYFNQLSRQDADVVNGTWTPAVAGGSTAGTYTPDSVDARYTRIGNLVHVTAKFGFSAASGGSGDLEISGLPFNYSASSAGNGPVRLSQVNLTNANPAALTVERPDATESDVLIIVETKDNAVSNTTPIGAISTSSIISFSMTYFTESR